jgi:hypothetical protein
LHLQLYKAYVTTLTNRVNSINGRLYKQDPTIWCAARML